MDRTVIVTGGTRRPRRAGDAGVPGRATGASSCRGSQSASSTACPARRGSSSSRPTCSTRATVAEVVEVAAGDGGAAAQRRQPRRRFLRRGKVNDTPIEDFEASSASTCARRTSSPPRRCPCRRTAAPSLRLHPRRAAPVRRRRRLLLLEGRRARVRRGLAAEARTMASAQRDRAEHHRDAGQPRLAARRRHRQVGQAGADRRRPCCGSAPTRRAPPAAPRCPCTAAPRRRNHPRPRRGIRGAIRAGDGVGGTCRKEESRRGTDAGAKRAVANPPA